MNSLHYARMELLLNNNNNNNNNYYYYYYYCYYYYYYYYCYNNAVVSRQAVTCSSDSVFLKHLMQVIHERVTKCSRCAQKIYDSSEQTVLCKLQIANTF